MSGDAALSVYAGLQVALLTQHGKERVIAPVLEIGLGCKVERVDGFDTNRFGTFTREIPRVGTQLEAARQKARQGMALSHLRLGLASEGAFGPDPMIGMLPWNLEVVVWIDDELGIEVVGTAENANTNFSHMVCADWDEMHAFARKAGFPAHWMIVRPDSADDPQIRKELTDWSGLEEAFIWAQRLSIHGRVFIETDMRAHANPTRMDNITSAAEDLVRKLTSLCPACSAPGFELAERIPGLPCELCGTPTNVPVEEINRCQKCGYERARQLDGESAVASAARCPRCNP